MRKCRRDGNCFYRAFAFALICELGKASNEHNLVSLMTKYLDHVGYEEAVYDDFLQSFLCDVKQSHGDADHLQDRWAKDEYDAQSSIVLLRLVTSAYLQINAESFKPFIVDENFENENSMKTFCQVNVECIGVESDQIHIIALCQALGCKAKIAYLDGTEGDEGILEFGEVSGNLDFATNNSFPFATVNLLYRPGHYDLLVE